MLLLLHLDRLFVTSIANTYLFHSFAPPVPWRTYYFSLDKPGEQQERGFRHWKTIATAINQQQQQTTTNNNKQQQTTCRDSRVLGNQARECIRQLSNSDGNSDGNSNNNSNSNSNSNSNNIRKSDDDDHKACINNNNSNNNSIRKSAFKGEKSSADAANCNGNGNSSF